MNLFTKVDRLIDYNNHYSLRKGLETLRQEFEMALKYNDPIYASEALKAVEKVYDKLHSTYKQTEAYEETMSFYQKIVSVKIRKLIEYMNSKLKGY